MARLRRRATVTADSSESGQLDLVRKPSFLDVRLERLGSSDLQTVVTVHPCDSIPAGLRETEIVLKDTKGALVRLPVYRACDP